MAEGKTVVVMTARQSRSPEDVPTRALDQALHLRVAAVFCSPPFRPARVATPLAEDWRRIATMECSALCVNLRMTRVTVSNSPFEIPAKSKSFMLLTSGTTLSTPLWPRFESETSTLR